MVVMDVPSTFGGVDITPIAEAADSLGTFMAIYGSGGVGKTTIAGKVAEQHAPLLYVDAEGGGKSIKHIPNISYSPITTWRQALRTMRDLKTVPHPFKTVVIDNMSELQSLCITDIAGPEGPVQIQHYGECTARMLKFTRDAREISRTQGVHVFLIAWDNPIMSESGYVSKNGVGFTPSLAKQFPGIVTYVGWLTPVDNFPSIRKLSFMVSSKSDAKFRVSPTEAAADIPLELFVRRDTNVLADIIATESGGAKFDARKYRKPDDNEKGK